MVRWTSKKLYFVDPWIPCRHHPIAIFLERPECPGVCRRETGAGKKWRHVTVYPNRLCGDLQNTYKNRLYIYFPVDYHQFCSCFSSNKEIAKTPHLPTCFDLNLSKGRHKRRAEGCSPSHSWPDRWNLQWSARVFLGSTTSTSFGS